MSKGSAALAHRGDIFKTIAFIARDEVGVTRGDENGALADFSPLDGAKNTTADRHLPLSVVDDFYLADTHGLSASYDTRVRDEIGVDRAAQIIDAHIDRRQPTSQLRREARVSGHVNQRCNNAAMVITLIQRTA